MPITDAAVPGTRPGPGPVEREERRFMMVCITPIILFLVLVSLVPLVIALTDSFRQMSLTDVYDYGDFLGLDNFRNALSPRSPLFHSLWLTALFVVLAVPLEFVLGLATAVALNRDFRGRRFWVTILLIPTMIAPVVVGMIWRFMLMPNFGFLTYYLGHLGLFNEVPLFSNQITAFIALVLIDVWEWTPFMMLFMLAGLFSIPQDPIEAAYIDGATRWQIFRYVQIPLLRPMMVLALLFRTIDASKTFDIVHVLTEGGPGDATQLISVFAFRTSFVSWDLGVGAAVCLVLSFVSLLVASIFYKVVSRQTDAERGRA
ncbi:MAG: Binding-protein-dependent transport system inner rane component [Gammaproteobacteria bacterium]|nr:Binding-protein-dependent transport system inner rane component [Gammaproteobacteria bacterium]